MNSLLTVIIPLYNQEKYIEQCLKSVISQKNIDLSIIVVNDGSTDNSAEICKRIAATSNNVHLISQENRGLAGARLTGIKATKTDYLTFVDADDFIKENAYLEALEYMNKGVDQIFFEISRYYDDEKIKRERHILDEGVYDRKKIKSEIFPRMIWDFERNAPGIECSQCVRIVKREHILNAYERLNGKSFYYGEDIAITYPMMRYINSLAVVGKSYYMHRQRPGDGVPPYIASQGYFDEILNLYSYLRKAVNSETYDFNKQIDYLYIHSVELKKWSYGEHKYDGDYLFPFNKVPYGSKIILYAAGAVGTIYYKQITKLGYCKEILWVDQNAEHMNNPLIKSISELDTEKAKCFDRVVIAIENSNLAKEIEKYLLNKSFDSKKIVY